MAPRDSSWNRSEFTIFGKFCHSQVLLENYMRFVAVLFQTEYGTRKQKCWEFPKKSHSTELTSSKRLKKNLQLYQCSSRGKMQEHFHYLLPIFRKFQLENHDSFSGCSLPTAAWIHCSKTGHWVDKTLPGQHWHLRNSAPPQVTLVLRLWTGIIRARKQAEFWGRAGDRRGKGLLKGKAAEVRLKLWAG